MLFLLASPSILLFASQNRWWGWTIHSRA